MSSEGCEHYAKAGMFGVCGRCRRSRETAALTAEQIEWYRQTGHCGACGQPGVFCLCRTPCGCHELHEVGSGLVADPAEVFADVAVGDDQGELFGAVGGTE